MTRQRRAKPLVDPVEWVRRGFLEKKARDEAERVEKIKARIPAPQAEITPWIERIRQASAHITTLSIPELRRLPPCGEYCGGVYFLWFADDLVYIGKSKHIYNRISDHERRGEIAFDRHTCIILDAGRVHRPDIDLILQDHERAYIARYPTPYNSRYFTPGT